MPHRSKYDRSKGISMYKQSKYRVVKALAYFQRPMTFAELQKWTELPPGILRTAINLLVAYNVIKRDDKGELTTYWVRKEKAEGYIACYDRVWNAKALWTPPWERPSNKTSE